MKIVTKTGTVYDNITELTVETSPGGIDMLVFKSNCFRLPEIASITDTPADNDELVKSNAHLKECLTSAAARIEQLKCDLAEVQRRNECLSHNLSGVNEKVRALDAENAKLTCENTMLSIENRTWKSKVESLVDTNKRLAEDLAKKIDARQSFTQRFEITVKPV